ncbi:MAG TPA: bis(5'-nucleosyl)-tetraphosphatase (symmetrical) YqeK [Bacillota bacterium]|nr:bis(5'-nucleosyl)-tetraphosphatase (symmetrical) YqeK [Bacillota bacterium]
MDFSQLESIIESQLSVKRMEHTRGVISEAKKLAERYGCDTSKAEFAALCHDMARCISESHLKAYLQEFSLDSGNTHSLELAHGKIAAELLKRDWALDDMDIINAISFHTTGRQGMSMLEKIIYLADAIEPGRKYPGVERIRELAYQDLDRACVESMKQTIEYINGKGREIDDNTIKAIEDLLLKERGSDE